MTGESSVGAADSWSAAPHHDGSDLYVSDPSPRLGDAVTVAVRVPSDCLVEAVSVRTVPDGEPKLVMATVAATTPTETWWTADLVCHNPVTHYRFLLTGAEAGPRWLNGTGIHGREVPDASDFRLVAHEHPPPEWAVDGVVYQIFPDRFARSAAADARPVPDWARPMVWDEPVQGGMGRASSQLYGGDLDGIVEHLDHLRDLGVSVLYLTPIFPARSSHRYDAASFDVVDEVLGGEEALRRLTDAAHAAGMRVLGDFTTNHTGDHHDWFRAARNPDAPERDFYFWADPEDPDSEDYVGWLGVRSLPKLNYDSVTLRRRVFDDASGVVRRWLGPDGGLDGWRVDVANMTGRYGAQDHNHEIASLMRDAVAQTRPDALLVGEHFHDFTTDLPGDGWHGVMNYAGFTRPVWAWLNDPTTVPDFVGSPVIVPRLRGDLVVETMRDFNSRVAWQSYTHSFTLLGSHDTPRIRTLVGEDPRLVAVAAGLLLTLPGIPMLTYGDEIGMRGEWGEDGRRAMPWQAQGAPGRSDEWDETLRDTYRTLIGLRSSTPALQRGGLRWVYADADAIVFLRETADQVALVHCARRAHGVVELSARYLGDVARGRSVFGHNVTVREGVDGSVAVGAQEPSVSIWVYPGSGSVVSRVRAEAAAARSGPTDLPPVSESTARSM